MKVFIGSSSETLYFAKKVASWIENLNHRPIIWTDVFPLGEYTLDSLIKTSDAVDAAIFIFGEDDKIWFRKESTMSVRDNVLLEYGLFCGKLSSKRVAFICKGNPKIASDLRGVTYANIDMPNNAELLIKEWVEKIAIELVPVGSNTSLLEGCFKVTDLYNAFQIVFRENMNIENFRVFAISTFKSVQMMRLMSDLKIQNARILIRKYIEHDLFYEESMNEAIHIAIKNWKEMVKKQNIKNLNLSFFNYHPDEGFYIIDERYLIMGYLNYYANDKRSEFSNKVVLIDNQTIAGQRWIEKYIERFEIIYSNYVSEEIFLS